MKRCPMALVIYPDCLVWAAEALETDVEDPVNHTGEPGCLCFGCYNPSTHDEHGRPLIALEAQLQQFTLAVDRLRAAAEALHSIGEDAMARAVAQMAIDLAEGPGR